MNENESERARRIEETQIDLIEVFHLFLRKWWLIVGCLIIGLTAAGLYTKLLITPQYSATSMIYVLSKTTSITSVADLQLGTQLTADFQMLAKSRTVVNAVIEESGMDLRYSELVSRMSVENPSETHMLKLTVTDPDPEAAAKLSNAYAEVMTEQIADIMNTDKPNIAERAVEPSSPASPNFRKNIMMGGLAGAALACLLILIQYLMNDTIQTEEDVRKYLGLHTLAAMPLEKRRK